MVGRIKSLRKLDDEPVTEAEATAALRMAAGSRISQVSLLAHARTDAQPPANLSLLPNAQFLLLNSRNKPDRTGEQDNVWYSKVIMSLFGSFDIMLKSHVQSCFVRRVASASLAPVHTSPNHRMKHRNFIFGTDMHIYPYICKSNIK